MTKISILLRDRLRERQSYVQIKPMIMLEKTVFALTETRIDFSDAHEYC